MTSNDRAIPGGPRAAQSPFGAMLRKYRVAAGLTQEELAERSGLSARAISNLERGQTGRPFRASAELLARALALPEAAAARFVAAARGGPRRGTGAQPPPTAGVPWQPALTVGLDGSAPGLLASPQDEPGDLPQGNRAVGPDTAPWCLGPGRRPVLRWPTQADGMMTPMPRTLRGSSPRSAGNSWAVRRNSAS